MSVSWRSATHVAAVPGTPAVCVDPSSTRLTSVRPAAGLCRCVLCPPHVSTATFFYKGCMAWCTWPPPHLLLRSAMWFLLRRNQPSFLSDLLVTSDIHMRDGQGRLCLEMMPCCVRTALHTPAACLAFHPITGQGARQPMSRPPTATWPCNKNMGRVQGHGAAAAVPSLARSALSQIPQEANCKPFSILRPSSVPLFFPPLPPAPPYIPAPLPSNACH
jgi:hypothetical protein